MIDKRCQTKRRKVQNERRAPALFEKNEQANDQIDQPDQIDVEVSWRPFIYRAQIVQVGVVVTAVWRIRRPVDQIMDLAANARSIQIHLDVSGVHYLIFLVVVDDGEQPISGKNVSARRRRVRLDRFGSDAFFCVRPSDPIPRRRLILCPLGKVQRAGRNEQHRRDQQHPGSSCQDRALHCISLLTSLETNT